MNVSIATAQYPVTFQQDFASWAAHTEAWVRQAATSGAQLLLFPEYGSMELVSLLPPDLRADLLGQVLTLDDFRADFCAVFAGLARKYQCILVAPSFPVQESGKVVNRCFVFGKNGAVAWQDKFFMTRFELEEWNVQAGESALTVFEADWGAFGIQICYDVEFPIGAALLSAAGAQVLLAPSCTETLRGSTRVHVGARARALEQQFYTVVSPLIGNAPWSPAVDINFGHSAFYSTPDKLFPEEGILKQATALSPGWLHCNLDLGLIEQIRADGQTLNFKSQTGIRYGLEAGGFEVRKVVM
ncbi:MAG: carbon-nitrogen hydrolase family protein [Saprospiraceae bacterium]|nr:carbon-nitrogen hydrolase family protein [Saprospiraceae bacterium]